MKEVEDMIEEMGLEADVKIYFDQFESLILDELVGEDDEYDD